MFYDRKIKYLDYYESGTKVNGGGFAKLEVRDNTLRLELTVRGLHPTDSFDREIVLQGAEKEEILGQIHIQNGNGQYRCSCDADRGVGGTGISYEELCGIRIFIGGNREILCQWGNTPSQRRTAQPEKDRQTTETDRQELPEQTPWKKSKAESEKVSREEIEETLKAEPKETSRETPVTEPQAEPKKASEEAPAENSEMASLKEFEMKSPTDNRWNPKGLMDTINGQLDEWKLEEKEFEDDKEKGSEGENPRMESVEISIQPEPNKIQAQESAEPSKGPAVLKDDTSEQQASQKMQVMLLEDKWQQLSALYPHIQPFHDERDYLSLTPSDFVLFPTRFYRAVNNSFLLHGYYNYHHLILARIERRGEVFYYIGVPGNYFEREKQVAIMFGFESFECEAEPAKTGDFGYYMMRTEL